MSTTHPRRHVSLSVRHLPRLTRRRLAQAGRELASEGWAFVSVHAIRPKGLESLPREAPTPYALSDHPATATERAAFASFRQAVALVLLELVQHGALERGYSAPVRARTGACAYAEPDGTVHITRGLKGRGGMS